MSEFSRKSIVHYSNSKIHETELQACFKEVQFTCSSMKKKKDTRTGALKISVIIVTYKLPRMISRLLETLQHQTLSKKEFELIIIGDTSRETKDAVEAHRSHFPHFYFFNDKNHTLVNARDFALTKVRAPLIAITDDDTLPQNDWLETIVETFDKHPHALGVEGKITTDTHKPLFSNAPENLHGGKYVGCNTHYRTAALRMLGGHHPEFTHHREDTDVAFSILKHGPILFNPRAVVHHPARPIPASYLLRSLYHLNGDMKLIWRFGMRGVLFLLDDWKKNMGKSLIAWGLVGLITLILAQEQPRFELAMLVVFGYAAFKYFTTLRGRTDSIQNKGVFFIFSFVRELFYPLLFVFYFFAEMRFHREAVK